MNKKRTIQIVVGLVLTLVVGSLPFPVWDHELADVPHMVFNEAIYWALVAAALAYVVFVEKLPLASIGLRKANLRDWSVGLGFAIAVVAGLAALYFVVFPMFGISEDESINTLMSTPGWWLAISVIRAGVSEEILFRGYPIERLQELTGNRIVAVALPLIAFSFAHVGPWGWAHLVVAGFGGAMFTWLYLWRRNLWVNIAAHCLVDAVGVLAG